ncbi:MAG: hypothetical protein RLZZ500_1694 [Bacteroidota bacterium]
MLLFPALKAYLDELDVTAISKDRLALLDTLVVAFQNQLDKGEPILLNCICTHNSRRSHLTQLWSQAIAYYFEIPSVYTYSGGTEATAIYPEIIKTVEATGMEAILIQSSDNPIYGFRMGPNTPPSIGFSKEYDHPFNPSNDYFALMTCTNAEEACPIVQGALQRFSLRYEDPKIFDETDQKAEKYEERSRQIATEMKYIMSQLKP